MATGLVTNQHPDGTEGGPNQGTAPCVTARFPGDPNHPDPERRQPYALVCTYTPPAPPLLTRALFTDDKTPHCVGVTDVDVRRLEHEDFLTMPGFPVEAQSWTPTLSQGASTNISKNVSDNNYWRIGDMVFFEIVISATGSGSSGSAVTITLPVPAASSAVKPIGDGSYFDQSAVDVVPCIGFKASTTTMNWLRTDVEVQGARVGQANGMPVGAIAVTNGDIFTIGGFYRAA